MKEIADIFPADGNSLDCYYARRMHLFPAFRDDLHSGLNLAEVGNSSWKPKVRFLLFLQHMMTLTPCYNKRFIIRGSRRVRSSQGVRLKMTCRGLLWKKGSRWNRAGPMQNYLQMKLLYRCRGRIRLTYHISYPTVVQSIKKGKLKRC